MGKWLRKRTAEISEHFWQEKGLYLDNTTTEFRNNSEERKSEQQSKQNNSNNRRTETKEDLKIVKIEAEA